MSTCGAQMEFLDFDLLPIEPCEYYGTMHECILEDGHEGEHECACGEQWEDLDG